MGGGVCPAYDYGKIVVCVEGYGYAVQRRPNIARLTYDMARYTSSVKKNGLLTLSHCALILREGSSEKAQNICSNCKARKERWKSGGKKSFD